MEDFGSCVINIDLNRFNNFFASSDLYCAYRCLSYEEIANSVKSIVYHFFIGQVRIEKRQFTDMDHFTPFLAVAFVVAWRLVALRTIVEISPKEKIENAFEEDEVYYLQAVGDEKNFDMKIVQDAIGFIARLGGFTESYQRPGWQVLWQGWIKFYERVEGFRLAKNIYSQ